MPSQLNSLLANDLACFVFSAGLLASYHLFLWHKLRTDPGYTIQAVNATARSAWVEGVMGRDGQEILAVQTLRNAIMGPTFLGSTAVLLMIGSLTLTGQGDRLEHTWHSLNIFGAVKAELWLAKILLLLLDFLIAFMCFAQAVRLNIHVGYMINVPKNDPRRLTPQFVASELNRAGHYHWMGMRCFYFAAPIVFWLFGPLYMIGASMAAVAILYNLDRAPVR